MVERVKVQEKRKAGRPKGSRTKVPVSSHIELSSLARMYTKEAIYTIVEVMRNSRKGELRLAAANALLDRSHGKPSAALQLKPNDLQEAEGFFEVRFYAPSASVDDFSNGKEVIDVRSADQVPFTIST